MSDTRLLKPTYEELESMYHAQCACTDEWAEKARQKSDGALLQQISDLQGLLDRANATITERNVTEQALRHQLAESTRKLEEASKDAERRMSALRVARDRVQIDRDSLFDCHRNPLTNTVDDDLGIQGLEEYDVVLNQIDQAIEQGKGGGA